MKKLPEDYIHSLLYRAAWTELGLSYSPYLKQAVTDFAGSHHTTELLSIHLPVKSYRQGLPDDMSIQTFRIALTDKFIVFLCAKNHSQQDAAEWNIDSGYFGNLTKNVDLFIEPVTSLAEHQALFDNLFGKHD